MQDLDEVIARSTNFGYLAAHEPLLALHGAGAQSQVYTDPEASVAMARRFIDTMTRKVAAVLGVESDSTSLYERIDDLYRAGVLAPWVRQAFHYVRMAGNGAVRGNRLDDSYTALTAVRDCFDLGIWLHNTLTGGRSARTFTPPRAPDPVLIGKSGRDLDPLLMLLDAHQRRLAESIGRAGAAGPIWIHTGALAQALRQMAAEEAACGALRGMEAELAARLVTVASGFEDRLLLDRVIYGETLRANAERAAQVGKAELEQLAEIGRELRAAAEENSRRGQLVPGSRMRSKSFVAGTAPGGAVGQDHRGRHW